MEKEPTAEGVVNFARKMTERYSGQTKENNLAKLQYLGENQIEANKSDSGDMPRRVKTGMAGSMVDERTAVLLGDLFLQVTARGAGEAEDHASDKLEPFFNGAIQVMQEEGPVVEDAVQDLGIIGVFCTRGPMPAPQLWGDEELKKFAREMQDAEDEESFKEAKSAAAKFMANNFPIIWEHVPADTAYPVFRRKRLVEIIQITEMTRGEVTDEWGDIVDEKVENFTVYEYANLQWVATVVASKEPKMVRKWKHNMKVGGQRVVPYIFEISHSLPAGDHKKRFWRGLMFHLKSLFESIDETMTDIRTNIREYTTANPTLTVNATARDEMDGWPDREEVGEGNTIYLLPDEKPGRWPSPEVTTDAYSFLDRAKVYAGQVGADRPQLHGGGSSGESAVHLGQANAMAKSELRRPHKAFERAGTKAGRLIAASVIALNEHYPDADKVTVRYADPRHKSKEIAAGPTDVENYFHLIHAKVDLNVPFNEALAVQNCSVAINGAGLDPHTAWEMFLNIQNPQEIDSRLAAWQFKKGVIDLMNAVQLQKVAGSVAQGDEPVEQLLQRAQSLPEAAQMAIEQMMAQETETPRSTSTSANNAGRTARPQRMSRTEGVQV